MVERGEVEHGSGAPTHNPGQLGILYKDDDTGNLYSYRGSSWVQYLPMAGAVLPDFETGDGSLWSDGGVVTLGEAITAALTGTFLTTPTEGEVITGGQTIIVTLTHGQWVATGAAFDAVRQAII